MTWLSKIHAALYYVLFDSAFTGIHTRLKDQSEA